MGPTSGIINLSSLNLKRLVLFDSRYFSIPHLVVLYSLSLLTATIIVSRLRSSTTSQASHPQSPSLLLRFKRRVQSIVAAMSTRTSTLQDYNIRLTSASDIPAPQVPDQPAGAAREAAESAPNPPNWPDNRRQIPPYRPINRNLDMSLRPFGSNPPETAFVANMFLGVWVLATTNWTWNHTVGRVNKKWFTYQVGSEF
ncbi:hypothetical protein MKZ38_001556 [Zalerion maritima]|uniref:Uncharacterized protein n=1 Tax=Zalerion maritima TaxID=339359 RepID=A0AAD5RQS7_9PEZI|nr:hypothetical protein MKZ38_001556 [Zalerion maritima]